MDYTPTQIGTKITSFLNEHGQHVINTQGAGGGTMEEYPFGLMRANRGGAVLMLAVDRESVDKKKLKALAAELKSGNVKLLTGPSSGRPSDILVAMLDPQTLGKNFIEDGCRLTLAAARRLGFEPARRCALCGGEGCDTLGEFGGGYRPMHRACAETPAEVIFKNPQLNPPAYPAKGLWGALAGLLAGLLVMIASASLFGVGVASFPFLLLPAFIFYGYRLLGKKFNQAGFFVTAGVMAAGLPISLVALGACIYMQQSGLSFAAALAAAGALFSNPASLLSLMNISGLYLLCAGLLLWSAWKAAHTLSDKNVSRAVSALDQTLSDYDLANTIHLL